VSFDSPVERHPANGLRVYVPTADDGGKRRLCERIVASVADGGALGRQAPPAPRTAAELDPAARRLAQAPPGGRLGAAIALETSLIADYEAALLELAIPDILQTAATIMAAHAQHRALLRREAGRNPFA
jgi:hypothetical protein